jgi:hypothetical protein
LILLLREFYLKAGAIGEWDNGLACICEYLGKIVLAKRKGLLSELDEFFLDLLEVCAEPYYLL